MELNNTVVCITGGASGLGLETAALLSRKGARVAILDLSEAASSKLGPEFKGVSVRCDVTDSASIEAAIANIKQQLGLPRVCINCAGILLGERVLGKTGPHDLERFRRIIEVNLIGTFNVTRLMLKEMVTLDPLHETGERAVIINTSSIAAFEGQLGQAAYGASKGGVASLVLPIAREMAPYAIRVMGIAPGLFDTPMADKMNPAAKAQLIEKTVFPKRLGQPYEFAILAAHIIENPMLNGSTIRLDGAVRLF